MLDTIGLNYYNKTIDADELSNWGLKIEPHNGGFLHQQIIVVTLDNGAPVTVMYFPFANQGKPVLRLEFSLPHVAYGTNVRMVYDIPGAVAVANARLKQIPFLPHLDLWDGILVRLDVCYNHQVGDLVPYYVKALHYLEYAHRETLPYTRDGVLYKNLSVTTKFYDKHKRSGEPAAIGFLRQETTLRKRRVKKLLHKKRPTLRDITTDVLLDALEEDLSELDLLGKSIGTIDTVLEQLVTAFGGGYAAMFLYGHIMAGMKHPKDIAVQAAGVDGRTYEKRVARIAENLPPVVITEYEKPLPPLRIDRERVEAGGGARVEAEAGARNIAPEIYT